MTTAPRQSSPDSRPALQSTRERVLGIARGLFLDRGYEATTTGAIASSVGIKAPALYWHFSSKEEILYAIISEDLQRFIEAVVDDRNGDDDPPDAVRSFVRRYVLFQLNWRESAAAFSSMARVAELRHVLTEQHHRHLVELQRQVLDGARQLLQRGMRAGTVDVTDVTVSAFAVISICEQVVTWARPDGRLDAEQIADHVVELIERMIRIA